MSAFECESGSNGAAWRPRYSCQRTSGRLSAMALVSCWMATAVGQQPPVISLQPASQSVSVGAIASLRAIAVGTAPLRYEWRLGETVLVGETNATLSITNVQVSQAGGYQLHVTN